MSYEQKLAAQKESWEMMLTKGKKKKNQHKIGSINSKNKTRESISKDLFVSILQTSYRTYVHLYIILSVRKETRPDMLATFTS